ncbi:MAG: hypothetical protein EBU84_03950 [Actinobacteria bacterium]|nr:hypothetical protein [Actinomycetota bacterium]
MKFKVSLSTVVLAVMLLAYLGSLIPSKSKKEGFQSHAYASCVNGGFSKEFCLQNPPMPGQCQCRNGAVGTFQPGFKGRCVCDN